MKNIQELPNKFIGKGEVKGFQFNVIYKSEFAYIYQVDNGSIQFEVFERKNTPVCIDFGKRIYSETEFREIYPKSNSFGKWAWICKDLDSAIKKAELIEDKILDFI